MRHYIFSVRYCNNNQASRKESFSMILGLKSILSVVFYERKKIILYKQNFKVMNNNTFNNVFCNRIFPYYSFLLIFKKWFDFHKSWFIFSGKIFSTTLLFLILKIKSSNIDIFKKILLIIPVTENFTYKIGNRSVVENILPEKISHDLWKSSQLWKISKKR